MTISLPEAEIRGGRCGNPPPLIDTMAPLPPGPPYVVDLKDRDHGCVFIFVAGIVSLLLLVTCAGCFNMWLGPR